MSPGATYNLLCWTLWALLCALGASSGENFISYVIGNEIPGNISWNASYFSEQTIDLRLIYNAGSAISFGQIPNTGALVSNFQPKLGLNASHLLIANNATAQLQLQSATKSMMLNQTTYLLFQPLWLNASIDGFTVSKDATNPTQTIISMNGYIAESVFRKTGYIFNVSIANMTTSYHMRYNGSLSIVSATAYDPQHCVNLSSLNDIAYCAFTLNISNTFDMKDRVSTSSGYALLSVLWTNASRNQLDSNYFYINGFTNTVNDQHKVFVYSSARSFVHFANASKSQLALSAYQQQAMTFHVEDLPVSVYGILEDVNNADQYVFDCDAHRLDYYDAFGWRFKSLSNTNSTDNIINGTYALALYLNYNQDPNAMTDRYRIITNNTVSINVTVYNASAMMNTPIISMIDADHKNDRLSVIKGETHAFSVQSALNSNTTVRVYFEQCRNGTNGTLFDCVQYYPHAGRKAFSFQYENNSPPQSVEIAIPNNSSLQDDSGSSANISSFIVMNVTLCNNLSVISAKQRIVISTTTSSEDDHDIGQEALVGIVCASVIVAGLLVWFVCLRHRETDIKGYDRLNVQ